MKKPRKQYRPKPVNALCWSRLLRGQETLPKDEVRRIVHQYHTAAASIVKGKGEHADLVSIGQAMNLALMLSELGYGKECISVIKQGQEAVIRMAERYHSGLSIGFDGEGLKAVNEALGYLDQQIEVATINEIEAANNEVERRSRAGEVLNGVAA